MCVLLAHTRDVVGIARLVRGQDREVGVAEHRSVGVVVGSLVVGRQAHEPGHLGDHVVVDAQVGEQVLGEPRAALLVVVRTRVVDRVVEPGSEAYGVGGARSVRELVDVAQHLVEVGQVVIVPARFGVSPEQVGPVPATSPRAPNRAAVRSHASARCFMLTRPPR